MKSVIANVHIQNKERRKPSKIACCSICKELSGSISCGRQGKLSQSDHSISILPSVSLTHGFITKNLSSRKMTYQHGLPHFNHLSQH